MLSPSLVQCGIVGCSVGVYGCIVGSSGVVLVCKRDGLDAVSWCASGSQV